MPAPAPPHEPTDDQRPADALRRVYQQIESGQLDDALAALDAIIPDEATSAYWHLLRGSALQQVQRYDEAEAEYSQAIAPGSPYELHACLNRGETRVHLKKLPEAVADLQRAVNLDPKGQNPAAHRARALLITVAEMTRQAVRLKETE